MGRYYPQDSAKGSSGELELVHIYHVQWWGGQTGYIARIRLKSHIPGFRYVRIQGYAQIPQDIHPREGYAGTIP
jgi:hypothetical protein